MTSPHIPITGGCLCSAVRYESQKPPIEGYYCHCTMCRKQFGGLFSATARIPGSAFVITKGQLKYYRSSSVGMRGFCSDCGSPMVFIYEGNTDVWISIGSLDYPEDWPLTKDAAWGRSAHYYVDSKIRWYEISDALPQQTSQSATQLEAAKAYVARSS